jgi:glycosyltransferase involved in cell wall biosynthesis
MRILHATAPAAVGGLESVVLGLARGHRALGHEVHVAAVTHGSTGAEPFLRELEAGGVDVHALNVGTRAYGRERRTLADLCRRLDPDVLHTHGFRPDVVDGPVGWKLDIPTVTTVHGHDHTGRRERVSEWIQHRAFRRFDAVVAVSRPLVDRLRRAGVPMDRIHVLPNALVSHATPRPACLARRMLQVPPDVWHVGWVGRLESVKGPDLFLEAVSRLSDLPLRATGMGEGSMREGLEERTRRLGLTDRLRWPGALPDAARLLSAFDVLVISSRMEGTPMILLEAMAAGVPLVAAAVGGVPDVVGPAEALLVPSPDPDALAAGIRTVLHDPVTALGRAEAARVRLDRSYAPTTWLTRYEEIYRALRSTHTSHVP